MTTRARRAHWRARGLAGALAVLVLAFARPAAADVACALGQVGQPCPGGVMTCVQATCLSRASDGGVASAVCGLCEPVSGVYCLPVDVGKACSDGGVCTSGGSASSSSGGDGTSTFYEEQTCTEPSDAAASSSRRVRCGVPAGRQREALRRRGHLHHHRRKQRQQRERHDVGGRGGMLAPRIGLHVERWLERSQLGVERRERVERRVERLAGLQHELQLEQRRRFEHGRRELECLEQRRRHRLCIGGNTLRARWLERQRDRFSLFWRTRDELRKRRPRKLRRPYAGNAGRRRQRGR